MLQIQQTSIEIMKLYVTITNGSLAMAFYHICIFYLLHTVPTEASFLRRNVFDSSISASVKNTALTVGSET